MIDILFHLVTFNIGLYIASNIIMFIFNAYYFIVGDDDQIDKTPLIAIALSVCIFLLCYYFLPKIL